MPRCLAEVSEILSDFHADLAAHPEAALMVATVDPDPRTYSFVTRLRDVGATPLHLIALATGCLTTASAEIRARADAADQVEMIKAVEQALAALDFGMRGERAS